MTEPEWWRLADKPGDCVMCGAPAPYRDGTCSINCHQELERFIKEIGKPEHQRMKEVKFE